MKMALSIVAAPYRRFLTLVNRDLHLTQPECVKLKSDGWEEIGEGNNRLWEIYRGFRVGHRIVDARITRDGLSVLVKIINCKDK